jgi:hypothetical protein
VCVGRGALPFHPPGYMDKAPAGRAEPLCEAARALFVFAGGRLVLVVGVMQRHRAAYEGGNAPVRSGAGLALAYDFSRSRCRGCPDRLCICSIVSAASACTSSGLLRASISRADYPNRE